MRAFFILRRQGPSAAQWHEAPFRSRKTVTVISPESTVQDAGAAGIITAR